MHRSIQSNDTSTCFFIAMFAITKGMVAITQKSHRDTEHHPGNVIYTQLAVKPLNGD